MHRRKRQAQQDIEQDGHKGRSQLEGINPPEILLDVFAVSLDLLGSVVSYSQGRQKDKIGDDGVEIAIGPQVIRAKDPRHIRGGDNRQDNHQQLVGEIIGVIF